MSTWQFSRMKVALSAMCLLTALSLGACADRSPGSEPSTAPPPSDDPVDVTDGDSSPGVDGIGGSDTDTDTDTDTDSGSGLDFDTDIDIEAGSEPDIDLSNDGAVLLPALAVGSDAGRVVAGLRRIVGEALLDLNERLREGVTLTEQQQDCLGSYDPALGELLLALDCERPLPTSGGPVYLERGALYPSAQCVTSLVEHDIGNCLPLAASLSIHTMFAVVPGIRLPQPLPGSGVDITYDALDEGVLRVSSDDDALAGAFDCAVDLRSGASLPGTGIGCDIHLRDVADRIDAIQPSI